VKKDTFSTSEILQGIRDGNDKILHFIYDSYYHAVELMVLKKNGDKDLAKDIFQEALVTMYKLVQDEEFSIKQSSFFTFFYALSRNTLFLHYRSVKKDILFDSKELHDNEVKFDDTMDQVINEGLKELLFHKYIKSISEKCREIIRLIIKGYTSVIIAKMLKFTSDAYVRKRKKICLKALIEMIKKDPKSKELL